MFENVLDCLCAMQVWSPRPDVVVNRDVCGVEVFCRLREVLKLYRLCGVGHGRLRRRTLLLDCWRGVVVMVRPFQVICVFKHRQSLF